MPNHQYPEIYTQILANILIVVLLIGLVILLTLLYQKRKIQQNREMELLKAEMEKELLTTRVEIQENIQRELSMEIHDNVGQTLLLANVNLTILMSQIKENIEAIQLIQESKELLKKSMEDITAVSRSMNPDRIVEIGVFNAIAYELDVLKRKNILSVIIEIDEAMASDWQLKPEIQLVLFRIYQEGIKNILKYASASLVEFTLIRTQHGVDMLLKDNGVGFDLGLSEKRDGIGLRNIQKRVAIFNGSFDIESAPGKGTSLRIFIPSIEFTVKPIP